MLTSNELELRPKMTLGTLESNAEAIRDLVLAKLQDYTPANYEGRADEAKADRAILNNAEKALNAKRLELERAYMEPFNKFKNLVNDTCKAIKQASGGLDEIVKAEELRERDGKKLKLEAYWQSSGFKLVEFEKVLNPKWLNKTFKQKDAEKEIDAAQQKIFQDLKILENFPAEDVPLLKTIYLDSLDITAAMAKAEQLKTNRDRLAREKIEREEIEKRHQLQAQEKAEAEAYKDAAIDDLASQALGLNIELEETPAVENYALVLHGTREKLLELRKYMTNWGITYDKLIEIGAGVYSKE